ncbi:hypothetical protein NEOLEDRAFT_177547 [Neolentinus lepideus HHB14362 ss-1]|uniref:Uncharacterized protein n=1 Tax=Neolentinus lepideus HHB14362 ss-1 TaxID=1314782 RepID=A0A165TMC8_9AGAM|nr:hypothetical protein NEOLEDRAFT_177547 [Neolentinus lepideus HHB14362 ss-1]
MCVAAVGDLYIVLFDTPLSGQNIASGRKGIYFGASDHFLVYDLAKEVAVTLAELRLSKTGEPRPSTDKPAKEVTDLAQEVSEALTIPEYSVPDESTPFRRRATKVLCP